MRGGERESECVRGRRRLKGERERPEVKEKGDKERNILFSDYIIYHHRLLLLFVSYVATISVRWPNVYVARISQNKYKYIERDVCERTIVRLHYNKYDQSKG